MGSLNFIGGEKGGVGKSVMSRVLAQYLIDLERPFTCFDTDRSHRSLTRFYSDYAAPSLVDSYESLDAIVEAFVNNAYKTVLVDLAAQTLTPITQWIRDSELFDVFAELGISTNFWHVMDGGKDSVDLLGKLLDTFGDKPRYIVVLNEGRASDFSIFEKSEEKARALALGAQLVSLPKLQETAMRKIDAHNSSFWAAVNFKSDDAGALGLLERQRVKIWLRKAYEMIDSIG
ncbi:MAG TPA: hypothetical protein VFM32_07365, partial [Spongiibacteraceae bacterium]|nr:hypothetical protein [Spongiibacteraceae bacterium]